MHCDGENSLASLTHIRIVVVEPAGALNLGSIARVMKNMGLGQLFLVNPHCNHLGQEAFLMAVHGREFLERAVVVPDLTTALTGCKKAIATTGLQRSLPMPVETPKAALPWFLEDDQPSALIFGREDHGLSNGELNQAQRLVCIPTGDAYTSLNLAQAVAVCGYELRSLATEKPTFAPREITTVTPDLADLSELEGYYQHLERVLLQVGFLYPHTSASRMETFRDLYHRASPSSREVAMLRGILRQVEWAIANAASPE
ncbi:RNA methyltransferase [Picosynechococcus sp. PCC 73109]|nr:RNA methyltransferase [Picosynechococcus sp. PCC 73109]